jgi:hypothetical protein
MGKRAVHGSGYLWALIFSLILSKYSIRKTPNNSKGANNILKINKG